LTDNQYYTLIAVPLVGILMNGALYIYLGSRIDKLIEYVQGIDRKVAVLEEKVKPI
jgi:hypothetical protein